MKAKTAKRIARAREIEAYAKTMRAMNKVRMKHGSFDQESTSGCQGQQEEESAKGHQDATEGG